MGDIDIVNSVSELFTGEQMDWRKLPVLENRKLLFTDTVSIPRPGRIVPCLLCRKPFVMRMFRGEPDQICGECWKTYDEAARVVCLGQGGHPHAPVTICRLVPKVLDNGFYIRPRMILHSDACNVCRPGLTQSSIIEIERWERTRREPKIIVPFGRSRTLT
jgi:hypothetical protein